jgi:hypothetical protein
MADLTDTADLADKPRLDSAFLNGFPVHGTPV